MIDLTAIEAKAKLALDEQTWPTGYDVFRTAASANIAVDLIAIIHKQESELASAREAAESANSGTSVPQQVNAGPASTDELRNKLMYAAIDCAHSISHREIILHCDDSKEGNALHQLSERLIAAALAARQLAPVSPESCGDAFKEAFMEWSRKTDWVQDQISTFPARSLGMHRADVMREEIERLRAAPTIPSGWQMVPKEPTGQMVIDGFESAPDRMFDGVDYPEEYDAMSGCQQAAFRARRCWVAMLASAPAAPDDGRPA